MFDKVPRTKPELKSLYTNLKRKGITDSMAHILIDLCYNEKNVMRTSGFYWPGGPDSVLVWSNAERKLTLTPREADPGGTGADEYNPHFRFYSWGGEPILNRIYEEQEIQLPNEEGLFAVYFDVDAVTNKQKLTYTKNPTAKEQAIILVKKVLVSYIYWDYENQKAQFFGNDRHGSEVNPQQQLINHVTEYAKRNDDRELQIYGYILNGDGTSDDHVRYKVSDGDIWHDDIKMAIPNAGISEEIPVLYFDNGKPRIILNTVPVAYTTQLCYNSGGNSLVAALDNAYVMYHIFATNDKIENQHIVAVVGRKQYGSAAIALDNRIDEVLTIREEMPQTGKCYLGSVVYLVSSEFTNTPHAIMVTACNSCGGGLIINYIPITINIESNEYLTINEYNEITVNYEALKGDKGDPGDDGAPGAPGTDGEDGAPGADGDDGQNSYLYVAYASDDAGTGWSLTPTDALKYRAEIQSIVPLTPVAGDFAAATWVKYIGDDGDDGAPGAPGTDGEDGAPGADGDDGQNAYLYVAYASDNAGTGWSLTPTDALKYRAEIQSIVPLTPVAADFAAATWVKYIGDDGEDGSGGSGSEPPELHLDFEEAGDEFIYNVPYDMKFTSQVSENGDATIDIALNTNMARYTRLTITATAAGLVSLYGEYVTI